MVSFVEVPVGSIPLLVERDVLRIGIEGVGRFDQMASFFEPRDFSEGMQRDQCGASDTTELRMIDPMDRPTEYVGHDLAPGVTLRSTPGDANAGHGVVKQLLDNFESPARVVGHALKDRPEYVSSGMVER